jgi:integrase
MTTNPAKGLLPPKSKRPQDERDAFNDEDLEKIFYSKQYREDSFKHPHQFWLSPLGLYTGARLEELCQLYVSDLKQTGGIWYLDINDDADTPVWTLSACIYVVLRHLKGGASYPAEFTVSELL